MTGLVCELSADKFDKAVHGGLDYNVVLAECADLAFYIKPEATVNGNPMVVVTFTVQLPGGGFARAQATTTLALMEAVFTITNGWREGGLL